MQGAHLTTLHAGRVSSFRKQIPAKVAAFCITAKLFVWKVIVYTSTTRTRIAFYAAGIGTGIGYFVGNAIVCGAVAILIALVAREVHTARLPHLNDQ